VGSSPRSGGRSSLAFTGARAREILGLSAADCDLASGLIHIRPNDRRPLETRASRRQLPIPGPLLPVLAGWIGRDDRPSDWLFPHGDLTGPWLSGTVESRALGHVRALGERAGVPGLTLLCFRHSFATAAESWGLGELALQRLLGHGRPQTQRTYRHADPEQLRGAAELVRFAPVDRA
jgi:integrase